jgi:dTDP-4-dehydrorhamnose 3,5-epimerase
MQNKPTIINGGVYKDERGILQYVNDECPGNYRRFYIIRHPDTNKVRAWRGHKIEEKCFFVIKGCFMISVVQPANFEKPSFSEKPQFFLMKEEDNLFLKVPGGCYTGIKAFVPDSELLVLSGATLEESKKDDFRLPEEKWINWQTLKQSSKYH